MVLALRPRQGGFLRACDYQEVGELPHDNRYFRHFHYTI